MLCSDSIDIPTNLLPLQTVKSIHVLINIDCNPNIEPQVIVIAKIHRLNICGHLYAAFQLAMCLNTILHESNIWLTLLVLAIVIVCLITSISKDPFIGLKHSIFLFDPISKSLLWSRNSAIVRGTTTIEVSSANYGRKLRISNRAAVNKAIDKAMNGYLNCSMKFRDSDRERVDVFQA